MADNDHSLLLLDFLDTIEICSRHVMLERVHAFEELNEKKFRERFWLSKHATLHILSVWRTENHSHTFNEQLQLIPNRNDSLTMYYTL